MPESALKDREEQDQGRADADALIGTQVCMSSFCNFMYIHYNQGFGQCQG